MLLRMGRYTIKLKGGVERLENAHVDKVVSDAIFCFVFFDPDNLVLRVQVIGYFQKCTELLPDYYKGWHNWGEECANTMTSIGFTQCKASPCTFWHKTKGLRTYIHGDDFVSVGAEKKLQWL